MAKRERRQNTMDTASNSLQPAAASQPEQPSGFRLQSLGCSIEPPASSLEILASSLQLQALSSHTANTSIGLSPQAPDTDEEQDWWTPVGISDEQGYSPDCSCDGDDPVNNAGRRDLTDWWNSGKRFQEQYAAPSWMLDANTSMGLSPEAADSDDGGRRDLTEWWKSGTRFQEQYPAPSWTGAVVGHFSTFMHGNIPLHECHCDACGSTSGKDLLAQRAPPRPCLLTSLLPRCARAVSCDSDEQSVVTDSVTTCLENAKQGSEEFVDPGRAYLRAARSPFLDACRGGGKGESLRGCQRADCWKLLQPFSEVLLCIK
eukprot:TRINITY_DN1110_c0_g2_i1.p1 TRINITY_DN1110_c0_g2~~TRINITY_DN1110_c0_g2_i1.p1  ORF type:complete len:371 (+),score=73.05 TRINITY_DN1110_c0_g2_i1:167-1114(+)